MARILAAGTLLNGIAHVPFALVQGAGRPDLTARLHLAEFPVYLVLVYVLTLWLGIEGTAIAWTLRTGFDLVALHVLTEGQLESRWRPARRTIFLSVAGLGAFTSTFLPLPLAMKFVLLLLMTLVALDLARRLLLEQGLDEAIGDVGPRWLRALMRRKSRAGLGQPITWLNWLGTIDFEQ